MAPPDDAALVTERIVTEQTRVRSDSRQRPSTVAEGTMPARALDFITMALPRLPAAGIYRTACTGPRRVAASSPLARRLDDWRAAVRVLFARGAARAGDGPLIAPGHAFVLERGQGESYDAAKLARASIGSLLEARLLVTQSEAHGLCLQEIGARGLSAGQDRRLAGCACWATFADSNASHTIVPVDLFVCTWSRMGEDACAVLRAVFDWAREVGSRESVAVVLDPVVAVSV